MFLRPWALACLLTAVLVSSCASGAGQGAQPPSTTTIPAALAATEDEGVDTSQPTVAETVPMVLELPPLAPYGSGEGNLRLTWLADQAALVVLDFQRNGDAETNLDLTGLPMLADRVALGLDQLGLSFTRSDTADVAGFYGTMITVHDDATAAIARWERFTSSSVEGAASVRAQTRAALSERIDVDHVAGSVDLSSAASWIVARSADPSLLATEVVGEPTSLIAWSNREAQRYTENAVTFADPGFTIDTTSRTSPPSVLELPYDSGMVITNESFEWATFSATIDLPRRRGLWPAIWLLDDEACEAPGRCLGYESPAYHEIDILELRTQRPDEAHVSLHWWDKRVRSESSVAAIDSSELSVELDRRPGLLVWRLDGEVVKVHTGRVDSLDDGAHRSAPMRLIVNTAVGGSFSGSAEIGREGDWLGEALVPNSYPSELRATFAINDLHATTH